MMIAGANHVKESQSGVRRPHRQATERSAARSNEKRNSGGGFGNARDADNADDAVDQGSR